MTVGYSRDRVLAGARDVSFTLPTLKMLVFLFSFFHRSAIYLIIVAFFGRRRRDERPFQYTRNSAAGSAIYSAGPDRSPSRALNDRSVVPN